MCFLSVCLPLSIIICVLCLSQTGWSALLAAVYIEHEEIVLRLLEAGARPDIQDKVYCIVANHTHIYIKLALYFRMLNVYLKCLSRIKSVL